MYRTVKTDIWRDPWFHDLTPQSKCLFVYLFTNPSVSACGSMELSVGQIAFDTGMAAKKVEAELIAFGERVLWLPERNVIVVRNFYRHQRSQSSPTFTVAAKKAMAGLPGEAREWLEGVYPELRDTLPIPTPYPTPTLGGKETVTVTATVEAAETVVTPPTPSVEGDHPPKAEKPAKSVRTPIPELLASSIPVETWEAIRDEQRLSEGDLALETAKMVDHFKANGERKVDWVAAWRNWMRSPYRKPSVVNGHAPPDGYTWDQIGEWRERRKNKMFVSEERLRILEQLDGARA